MTDKDYMNEAIKEAQTGIHNGDGGPFGAVIVRDGEIIGRGHNCVLKEHDSTWHGETSAIRDAERNIGSHDLSGCVIYTTGEPCPMCLGACLWANIEHIYYGCSIEDNERIGFRDRKFDDLTGGRRDLTGYLSEVCRDECLDLFEEYLELDPTRY